MKTFALVKSNLVRRMRSYGFLWIMAAIVVLGVLCVPPPDANYSVVGIGGVRGIYNSAWLGAVSVIISCVTIWVPGFYWLRNEITDDRRLRIGEMLASSPISKTRYIISKTLANLAVLITLQLFFIASLIILQFIRGENYTFNLLDYFIPFLIISVPNLIVLASLTILFDVLPFLKGVAGNIIFVIIWMVISFAESIDIWGMEFIIGNMQKAASITYPDILGKNSNFGYNPMESTLPTFEWSGLSWNDFPLFPMAICFGASIILIILSIIFFDRFKRLDLNNRTKVRVRTFFRKDEVKDYTAALNFNMTLSPVMIGKHNTIALVMNEIRVMLSGLPIWYYLLILCGAIGLPFLERRIGGMLMLIPILILSQIGCRNKIHRTIEIVHSSCSPVKHMFSSYIAGAIVSLIISSINLVYLGMTANVSAVISWLIGIMFASALAMFCGEFSGNKRLFEAVYILIYYLGTINRVAPFDFLGTMGTKYVLLYVVAILLLLLLCSIRHIKFKPKQIA